MVQETGIEKAQIIKQEFRLETKEKLKKLHPSMGHSLQYLQPRGHLTNNNLSVA